MIICAAGCVGVIKACKSVRGQLYDFQLSQGLKTNPQVGLTKFCWITL